MKVFKEYLGIYLCYTCSFSLRLKLYQHKNLKILVKRFNLVG
jgi:hypothetical protein